MPEKSLQCQNCKLPVEVDESLLSASRQQLELLVKKTKPIDNYDDYEQVENFIPKERLDIYNSIDHTLKPIMDFNNDEENEYNDSEDTSKDNSYVFLSDESNKDDDDNDQDRPDRGNTISSRIHILTKIFDILSTNLGIDHPLCAECSSMLLENYKLKFDRSQKEKESYLQFLKKLKEKDSMDLEGKDVDMLLKKLGLDLMSYSESEQKALEELKSLEMTRNSLEVDLKRLKDQLKQINEKDLVASLQMRNDLVLELNSQRSLLEQSQATYQSRLNHLDKLRNMNVYSTFFLISFDKNDTYGTINNFRIGHKVPFSEINAALGQIVVLCIFLLKRLRLKLDNYKLVPMGSLSQIIKYSRTDMNGRSKSVLNLYTSNEFSIGKLFNFNTLDISMIALLDIVSQIEAKLTDLHLDIDIPYQISPKKDSIGGKSIRITSNSEWTQSCKFLLTKLNWILTYTSVHTAPIN